jgi:uncharacterized repeat protein (TIGR01451 family)
MKKILFSIFILLSAFNLKAQLINAFSSIKTVTQKGDITFASNAITQCTGTGTACTNGRSEVPPAGLTNNQTAGITMGYIDQDGSTGIGVQTFSSSSATLDMGGIGGCGVIYAYLTWGGFVATTTTNYAKRDSIYLQAPGGVTYNKFKADLLIDNTAPYNRTYHCYKDVTSIVKAIGPGSYTAGNIVAATGGNNQFAGWSLVVIYADNSKPLRNLTIFRGLAGVSGTTAVQFNISGFYTPPAPAPVNVRLGLIAYDGDRAVPNATGTGPGDSLKFNGVAVFNGKNPQDDIFNSTITIDNNEIVRNPSFTNTLGYDADIFTLTNPYPANPYLTNGASSATLRISSGGETILTDIVFTVIDVFEPEIRLEKSYNNLTRSNALPAQPGDIIEFTITASNKGSDPADSLFVTDSLYGGGIFVPNSMRVTQGANIGSKTDAIGDDQMDFDATANVVKARLGIGANGTTGGKLKNSGAIDSISTFKFQVQISADCEIFKCKDSLYNMAFATYKGETSQGRRTLYSAAQGTDVNGCPLSGPVAIKIDVNPVCPPYADTTITACAPYNLSNILPYRPGFNTFYNSIGTQVNQATTNGTYYAVRTLYPGFTWLPGCKDSIVITFTAPCTLSISLIDFTAKYINKKVQLNWKTAQEINNHHFEIERSLDGYNFEKIVTIDGALNSSTIISYSYDDITLPNTDKLFYRLVQVDIGGARKNSGVRAISLTGIKSSPTLDIYSTYPNPVNTIATFRLYASSENIYLIKAIDMVGNIIFTTKQVIKKGESFIPINMAKFNNGLYLVEFINQTDGTKTATKILKQ